MIRLKKKTIPLCNTADKTISHLGRAIFLSIGDFVTRLTIPFVVASENSDQRMMPVSKRIG